MERTLSHIAIIMDGNGRWAKKRFLPRSLGHRAGANNVRPIIEACVELGVKYLTLYAFSSENWNRPQGEISELMGLFQLYLVSNIQDLHEKNIKLCFIGEHNSLPEALQKAIQNAQTMTFDNTALTVNVALNYGSRTELAHAFYKISQNHRNVTPKEIEDLLPRYLYTSHAPDPDLIIRTSGEQRLSNFLLWQAAYSEFYFTDILWPDFKKKDLEQAVEAYKKRDRRYGGVLNV